MSIVIQSILFDVSKFSKDDSKVWLNNNNLNYISYKYKDYDNHHYICYRVFKPDFLNYKYDMVKFNDGICFMVQIKK